MDLSSNTCVVDSKNGGMGVAELIRARNLSLQLRATFLLP